MKDTTEKLLRSNNLKATPARISILTFLEKKKVPVDVTEVEAYLKSRKIKMNQSTVYRILNAFVDNRLVKRIEFQEGKSRYELSSLPHHHHVVCIKCGAIEDVTYRGKESLERLFASKSSFIIQSHNLEFFGLCARCQ